MYPEEKDQNQALKKETQQKRQNCHWGGKKAEGYGILEVQKHIFPKWSSSQSAERLNKMKTENDSLIERYIQWTRFIVIHSLGLTDLG